MYEKKKQVMTSLLAVEMRSLGHYLAILAEQDRYARDLSRGDLANALTETTACFPVYRTYIRGFSVSAEERRYIEKALECARRRNPGLASQCFDFIARRSFVAGKRPCTARTARSQTGFHYALAAVHRSDHGQRVGGFCSLRLLSRSVRSMRSAELPIPRECRLAEFHLFCRNRQKHGHTLNATATHDTKRAEDVRARISVLSEVPEEWDKALQSWTRRNMAKKIPVNGQNVPDPNEEYLVYQTMLGAWPLDKGDISGFRKRLQDYMVKAVREANVHTDWSRPNVRHEQALIHFIKSITQPSEDNKFLARLPSLAAASCLRGGDQFPGPAFDQNHRTRGSGFLSRL